MAQSVVDVGRGQPHRVGDRGEVVLPVVGVGGLAIKGIGGMDQAVEGIETPEW